MAQGRLCGVTVSIAPTSGDSFAHLQKMVVYLLHVTARLCSLGFGEPVQMSSYGGTC